MLLPLLLLLLQGDLLLLQPRDLDNADTMVQEVVHSVMQVTL